MPPVSSAYTRKLLSWNPVHRTLLEDLETGDYFSPGAASAFDEAELSPLERHSHQ